MSSVSLKKKSTTDLTIEEVEDIEKDKKKIKADGFEEAYSTFLKALPIMVEDKQYYKHYHFYRVDRLNCTCEAYVAKKIYWENMQGRMRVVFCVKSDLIRVIEVYVKKGDQQVEDRTRICEYCT